MISYDKHMSDPIPGWYPDPNDGTRQRYWDGDDWGDTKPLPPAAQPAVGNSYETRYPDARLDAETRSALKMIGEPGRIPGRPPSTRSAAPLDQAIGDHAAQGYQLVVRSSHDAVMERPTSTNNALHFVLTLLTAGLWLIVWGALLIFRKKSRVRISVSDSGLVRSVPVKV